MPDIVDATFPGLLWEPLAELFDADPVAIRPGTEALLLGTLVCFFG
jgi:hypothetical protein